jgi:SpoVK/Ycf46/Vps4 family AAA+-type ATPase
LFVLTTNRPDLLEPALAARPGRVDLAVEIPLPDAECRRRLLDRYLEGLQAHGVAGYSRDDLARDYGRGGFLLFMTAFFAAMVVKQTARGDDMFIQMLGSASQHIADHDALASLA